MIEIFADAGQQSVERRQLRGLHTLRGSRANAFDAGDNFVPNGFGRRLHMNQLPPPIVAAGEPLDPAIPFHAVENADEGGRFQMHPLGQFSLREWPFEREKPKHLALPIGDASGREFFIHRPLIFMRGGHDPEPDAVFKVVFKHGNGFRTNGKRPNDYSILAPMARRCKLGQDAD